MDSRYYPGVEADVSKLVAELRNIFDQDYEVQTMNVSSTTVVQARKSSTLRDLTGLSAALTIKVTNEAGGTRVEIGMQKWCCSPLVCWWPYRRSALTGNTKSPKTRGRSSKPTSRAKPVAMCRLCLAAAAIAARQTAPATAFVPRAERISRPTPAPRAGQFKEIRQRGFVINAGNRCLRKANC